MRPAPFAAVLLVAACGGRSGVLLGNEGAASGGPTRALTDGGSTTAVSWSCGEWNYDCFCVSGGLALTDQYTPVAVCGQQQTCCIFNAGEGTCSCFRDCAHADGHGGWTPVATCPP